MMNCQVFKKLRDDEKYQLESGVWNVHPNHPPLNQVPLRDADFEGARYKHNQ